MLSNDRRPQSSTVDLKRSKIKVEDAKMSNLLQLPTKMFHNGPSIDEFPGAGAYAGGDGGVRIPLQLRSSLDFHST